MTKKRKTELASAVPVAEPVATSREVKEKYENLTAVKVKKNTMSVQDRVSFKAVQIYDEIDRMFEEVWVNGVWHDGTEVYDFLVKCELSRSVSEHVRDHCIAHMKEFTEHADDYGNYKKSEIKKFATWWQNAVDSIDRYVKNVTVAKVRKPRKKRAISLEKKLKGFKYAERYDELQLASVNPQKVIGAVQVWLFNYKNKTLTMLTALDRGGIDIKGQTFQNVDVDKSMSKRIGRKTKEHVDAILKKTKPQCKRHINDIKYAPIGIQTRSNATTVILRVF